MNIDQQAIAREYCTLSVRPMLRRTVISLGKSMIKTIADESMGKKPTIREKIIKLPDHFRRRIAYVPRVNETISALRDIGIELKQSDKVKRNSKH